MTKLPMYIFIIYIQSHRPIYQLSQENDAQRNMSKRDVAQCSGQQNDATRHIEMYNGAMETEKRYVRKCSATQLNKTLDNSNKMTRSAA